MSIKNYTDKERKEIIEKALELRYNEHKNWLDIADDCFVARSTLNEWRKLDEWKDIDARWRRMLRDEARGSSSQMLSDAVDVMYELMKTDKSGYVRFMAASKIAEWNNVGQELEERIVDQSKELQDFLMRTKQKEQTLATVQPGGLLPAEIQEKNQEYKKRKIEETQAIEAEFREVEEDRVEGMKNLNKMDARVILNT